MKKFFCACFILVCFVACLGLEASADVIEDNFNTPNNLWSYNGITSRDSNNGYVVLTPNVNYVGGSLFFKEAKRVDRFNAQFDMLIRYAGGADGLTFAVIDSSKNSPDSFGDIGGNFSYTPLSGFAVEFDTWYNAAFNDPAGHHVGLDINGSPVSVATNNSFQGFTNLDSQWHHVEIDFNQGQTNVYLAGLNGEYSRFQVLSANVPNFETFNGYFGFTSATATFKNEHIIDNVKITTSVVPEPASMLLFTLGSGSLALLRRKKKA